MRIFPKTDRSIRGIFILIKHSMCTFTIAKSKEDLKENIMDSLYRIKRVFANFPKTDRFMRQIVLIFLVTSQLHLLIIYNYFSTLAIHLSRKIVLFFENRALHAYLKYRYKTRQIESKRQQFLAKLNPITMKQRHGQNNVSSQVLG